MSGEQPKKLVDDQDKKTLRTGNHDRRPKSLIPIINQQQTSCLNLITVPGPPSGYSSPNIISDNKNLASDRINEPSIDYQLNPTIYYASSNVQYANITPNRACSILVGWREDDIAEEIDNQQIDNENSQKQSLKQTLSVNNPPPELSVSPADTLSKTSSDNLSAFSPNLSLSNQPFNESINRIHSLKHHSRKHRKFKQISPLASPIWPLSSSQYDQTAGSSFNRPSSQPHSPSSLSVNYIPSPVRDRSYSAGCTSTNFIFPPGTTTNVTSNITNLNNTNVMYSSNHSLVDTKQNSAGSISPASSINEFNVELEALEKAIKQNDWRLTKKLLNACCSNLNRVYSSSSMNLNLIANQTNQQTINKASSSMRASLFEKLSGNDQQQQQPQQSTQLPSANQSYTQYRAYSAFDEKTMNRNLRKESADSQLSNNLISHHGRIGSPLFNNLLHLAIEYSSIDVVSLLLRSGYSANTNDHTPLRSLDVWRRRSDSSHDSHHHNLTGQSSTELMDTSGPLIYNQMGGSRLLYSSREQLMPLLSSSPHLLSPSAVLNNGSNSNLYALCNNNRMRFSITSEQSSEQNSELSSIGRYSTPPKKLIKINPTLPLELKLVRIGEPETKPLNESSLKRILQDNKLHFREFNCCKCCNCRTENLVLNLPKPLSAKTNRKISLDTTHSNAPNRRKSSVSLANVSGIIQHAVQKNVSSLEKTLHHHHHQNQTIMEKSSLNTLQNPSSNTGSNTGSISGTLKGHSNEQLNNKSSDLNKDLNKLMVCCVSNIFNKRNCCGTRYAANRYHCHCPLKEIVLKQKLLRKLTKRLSNKKFKFSKDLDLNKLEEFIKSTELTIDEKSEQNLDSIKKILYLHFKQHKHIINPFKNMDLNSDSEDNEDKNGKKHLRLNLNKNSSLNRLLDSDESNEKEDSSSSSDEETNLINNKEYAKINSDKSTNESGEDEKTNEKNKKEELKKNENRSSLTKKQKKHKKRKAKFKDQPPLLIVDEKRKQARRRRKKKKIFNEEKRCSSCGEQDSDGQQRMYDYDNNYRIYLNESSEESELSDSSVTFDSENEFNNYNKRDYSIKSNKENGTSKDELSDESISKPESKRSKKDRPELELKKKERKLFKKQLTDTSIKTSIENELDEEKHKFLKEALKSKSIKTSKKMDQETKQKFKTNELKYDTNNYTTIDEFYNREVLYVLPPLFLAVVNGNIPIVKELIKFGASVNAQDSNGCTVLHLLLCQQRINQSLLNLLLGNGAKLATITNLAGVSPIDLALEKANQLIGLQRKMIMTAFSGLINGLEAICTFNELNKQTMRNQSSSTNQANQMINNSNLINSNIILTTSTNSIMVTTDTVSHSNQISSKDKYHNQLNEKEISHTLATSSVTGLTSSNFQSSSNTASDQINHQQLSSSSQNQEHSGSTLISVQQYNVTEHSEENIRQPFYMSPQTDSQQQNNLGIITIDGNSGSSGGHSNQTDKSTNQQQQNIKNQLASQLNQSTSNLHPTSELIKKMSQRSQEDSGSGLTSIAALKAANFLRKLKASAKSSKQRKQQQLLQQQQNLLQQQQQELQQQTDVYLCLEEISSDGPSHSSNRFAYCSSYYETSSMNNEEVFEDVENQQNKQSNVNTKKEDDLHSGELNSGTTNIGTINSTTVLPNTTSGAGTRRKKSLGKIYNFIEPSAPGSGLNYIINSIKGTTTHAPTVTTTNTLANSISHPPKHSISSKTSNPLSTTGNTGNSTTANSNLKTSGNRFTNTTDQNRYTKSNSLVQLDNLSRGAESGLLILIKMSTNIECVPFIMQVFNTNINSIVNVIDRSSNEKLNKMIAVLFNRLLLTIVEQIETSADTIRLTNNLTYSKLLKLTNKLDDLDQQQQKTNQRSAALFTKWAAMDDVFQYVNNLTIGKLSTDLPSTNKNDSKLRSSPNSMLKNLEKLKQFASFKNAQPTSGLNLCKHMKSKISDDLIALLKMAIGCLRGGQSLQYTALLVVNKIIDTLIVYDVAYNRPVRKINSCFCLIHQHNCCKQRALRRNKRKESRISARMELTKKNGTKIQKQNSLDHKTKRKLNNQKIDSLKRENEDELDQQKLLIAQVAAATTESLKATSTTKPTTIKRSSIFSAALFGFRGSGGSGSDTSTKSDANQTPKHKQKNLTGILASNLRRASIKTGLIKDSSPSKSEKSKSIEKPILGKKSDSIGSNELNQINTNNLNGQSLPNQPRRSNPFISKLSKSLLIKARAVGKLSKHSALIMHHRQHSSSVESTAEKNLYLAAVAKEDQVNAARRKRKIRRCTCKSEMKSAFELLVQDGISLLLNVLNNSITLHKRVAGSKQLCTPSHRRQCSHHCMALLSARSILYLTSNAETRKLLVKPSALKILLSSLDCTNDPQLLTVVLQIVASLALDIQHQKSLLNADFTDALLQLILPSDEWFYTNVSTKYSRYVKHHAARILIYLGLEKRLRNKVYLFDLLEETLTATNLISPQSTTIQKNKPQTNLQQTNLQQSSQQQSSNQQQQQKQSTTIKQTTQTSNQTETEDSYICVTSIPPLNIYRTLESQQLLNVKENFEQTKPFDKNLDKHLYKYILNELDFEPKLVSSSAESIILQLLQQIENRLNDGENEEDIIELNENIKFGIDSSQFKTIFDIIAQMIQDKQLQQKEQLNDTNLEQNTLFNKDLNQINKDDLNTCKQTNILFENQIKQNSHDQTTSSDFVDSANTKQTRFSFTEQQYSQDQTSQINFNQPPPSIQVDFISSDRSSPRRSSSQRSSQSLNAEEAKEATKLAKERIEEEVNSKLDLRDLKLQYQHQLELNNRQQFFLKTLSICLNPVIVLRLLQSRLLQHRLFGCYHNLWYWQQNNGSSHHPSICLSNASNQTALYHLLNTRANSGRSSFASTCGMDSFQGLGGAISSRSRASSATANSIILPNELYESNLRNRRNVSLTINPLGLSLSNLNNFSGQSSSQRTSISVDRSSKQDSYRKASVRSGSGDDHSVFQQQQSILLNGLNIQQQNQQNVNAKNQDAEILEFQKQLQNIPRNEHSPIATKNFVNNFVAAVSSASNQLLINNDIMQQRRNTATLFPQAMNTSMDSLVVSSRPRSCSMPQQQQMQQQQCTTQINQTISTQTSSNQLSSSSQQPQLNYQSNPNYTSIQQIHNLTNQQLQTLINQQLQNQNLINQHLQNQFRSQNYSSQQLNLQKDKQQNYQQQTDQSSSQNNSLEDKNYLYTQGSLDSLTPLIVYNPQQRNFFDRSLSIAVPEPIIFQQTQFKQLMPSQRPQTSSNQSFVLDASTQSNLNNVNCSHSSVSTNPMASHFTNAKAGRLSFSLRSTSGNDVYNLLNNLAATTNLNNRFMPNQHRAIFILLIQWIGVCSQDFILHDYFRKELNEFLNRAKNLGELYLEKVNKIKKSANLEELEIYEVADNMNEDNDVNDEYTMLQQLIVSGSLLCCKDDVAKLAGIQLRIQEINVQQSQEPQQIKNPIQLKNQSLRQPDTIANLSSYSQPNSSKTPPSSEIFNHFEQPISLNQTFNQSSINNLRLAETTNLNNISNSLNNQLNSTPSASIVTPLYSSTGTSVKLHPISEYGYKDRNKIRTSGGRAFAQASRFGKAFNLYGNSDEDLDLDQQNSKASSASALESSNYLASTSKKQRSDEFDEEQIDDTVFEQEQFEDEELLEDLDEDERISEDEENLEELDLDLDEDKIISDEESVGNKIEKDKTTDTSKQSKDGSRLPSEEDFEFECDLTDSERYQMRQKINEKQQTKKVKTVSKPASKRKSSQSSDNLLSPYRRQSVGHSPTNRANLRPQLINTKRQKKFKSRLHADAYKRRYSDVFFANAPISQPGSQQLSRLSNISDQMLNGSLSASSTSRPSSAKLDSRPQSALENLLTVQSANEYDRQQKLLSTSNTTSKEFTPTITPTHYVRNRSPSCAVVPSHYIKQNQPHRESIDPTIIKQTKRRGMSLSLTASGARQLTNQVTRKLSKQLSKLNQGTKNLLSKTSSPKLNSPKTKEHSISVESSKDVVRDISEFYSSIETPPSSSLILGANVLIYPMINSPVQATLNQASLAAVAANSKLMDQQFSYDILGSGASGVSNKKEQQNQTTSKDGHMFMNQMKKAKNVFRSFIPLQLNTDTFTSNLFDLKECLPAIYYSTKGIDKAIKEQKRKLFHSQIYDNSLELKKLYIQNCKRLPAYDCSIFEVKEIIRTRTTRKRISRLLALGINKISLLDASNYSLTRQQKTKELIEWRSGLGSSGDRIQLEFRSIELRNSKWNLVACSSNSLNNITRTLLNIMMNSLQTSSAFLAKLLNVDEKLFVIDDQTNQLQSNSQQQTSKDFRTTTQFNHDIINQSANISTTNIIRQPKVLYSNEFNTNLNVSSCEELELLYTMLHFPEEVALRLAEVDYDLFYKVTPVDYIQHITLSLNQINLTDETSASNLINTTASNNTIKKNKTNNQNSQSAKTYTVQDLIRRFNRISAWVAHMIIIQPTHDDRKAVLSCLIRIAQCAWNLGAFNTSLQIIAGLKCEKIRPFMLCIKNNENPKHLNYLIDALLFTDQPSAEYCDAVQRAFAIRQSFLVPFFGNFIKDLHTIFQSMSSLAVRAYNQATINQFNSSATLHFGDRRMLDFVFDYNSQDHFTSKISVGNLINVEKMNAAERVLNNIASFHIHANRRLIDLTKCTKITNNDLCDCINKNTATTIDNNTFNNQNLSENKSDQEQNNNNEQQENTATISAQCTSDQQNQPLNESTSLVNIANLTTSASISAGNLNTLASSNSANAGSMPLSPWATSSTQTFQQQQISTVCSSLQQYNIQSNQQTTNTPVSPNTTSQDLTNINRLLDNNNNRLSEQQQKEGIKTGSNQCLHSSVKDKSQQKITNIFEDDSLYELDYKNNYKPIQPLPYNHGVSFIPLSGEQFFSNLNAIQLMQHGTTCIHYEEETNRISLVYLQLEQSNSILGWSKPSWSALKKNYTNNFTFFYSKNQQQQNQNSANQTGTNEKQTSNQPNAQSNSGGNQGASNLTGNTISNQPTTSSTSSAPASDYTLQLDIEERIMPIILQRFVLPLNPIAINSLEEGFIDLFYVKHLSKSSLNQIDFVSICKRVGLCYNEFNERTAHIICLQFGSNLIDNRRSLFIMTNRIGKMWSDGLTMVCDQLKKQKSLFDQRLNWLKFKYLQLYYEGGACVGPTSAQSIASFGGRKWQLDTAGPDSNISGISPLMYASYLKDESISGKGHQQSGSGQSSIDLSGKRASSFAITKLRKKKSTSSLSTMPKDGSPKSRASSGEDLAISNVLQQSNVSNEIEKSKKDRFKMFHKRSSPNLKCTINTDSQEKKDQIIKTTNKQSGEKPSLMFSQSSSQDYSSGNSFCSIDSPPIIYTSQLTFEYQEMLRRNLENGLGCCELYSNWSESNSLVKLTSNQPNKVIQLSFIEFFELFKAFVIRSRKDVRELFDNLSSKTITSQKANNHPLLIKQTSVDQASSSMSGQDHLNHEGVNLVRSMSVSEDTALTGAISNVLNSTLSSLTKQKDDFKIKSSDFSSPKQSKSFNEKYISRKRRLTRQFSINQPLLGLISRNCSHQINDPNIEKRLQIFDAIATASILNNCAGLETTQRLTSIPSETNNQQTLNSQLILSYQQFGIFIRNYQKEKLNDEQIISLIHRHEPNYKLREQNCLSFEGFNCYLSDKDNSAFLPQLNPVKEEDMDYPLSHYFIATSHNTYLTWYQGARKKNGESSVDMYGEVLLAGCRCVELDVYDSDDGFPLIYHGRTFTTKISFKRVVETINQFAFVTSPYPVILSIENHCSVPQQIRMAQTFKEIFKEKLVTDFLFDVDYTESPCLPSPNQLKYRILIKNKKLKSFYNMPVSTANNTAQQQQQQQQAQPQKQSSLPQQTNVATSTTPTNASSNLSKMGKSFPSKGFTSDRTNSLISAASTVSLNEEDFDEDDDEEVVIKQLDKLDKVDSPKTTPLKTTRAYSQGSYSVTPTASSTVQQPQQQQSTQFFIQQSKTAYHPKVARKSSSQVAKELSDLVIYCQAIKFRSLFNDDRLQMINNSPTGNFSGSQYRHPNVYANVYQVASLSENYAKKIYRKSPVQLLNYNHHNLLRVYPAPTRLQSSNFNPLLFWSFGVQLAALNYQTEDQYLAINQTMFEQNNFCGYVLKPEVMRSPNHIMYGKFNPLDSKFDGLYAIDLTIKIISGQSVCLEEQHNGSPLVEVEICGLEADCSKQRTRVIQKNSLNPIWNDSFSFRINFIDLAFIKFTVYDYGQNHATSQRCVPLKYLRSGYRHLQLRNMQNQPLALSSLFIYSNMQEEGCLMDDPSATTTSDTNIGQQIINTGSIENLFRRLVIIQVHNVRPDEATTIMKIPQEAKTYEIILQTINKQKQYQASLQPNLLQQVQQIQDQLQRSTTFKQQTKILMDVYSNLINDFVLIEEIQRQPSQSFTTAFQTASQRSSPATQEIIKSERCQRILEADERPLEGHLPSACTNRKFILKKISDDPSCRAYITSLMKNQNKFISNLGGKKAYDDNQLKEQQQLTATMQQITQQFSNLSPSGKRSSSSLSGSMKKELYAKDGSGDESTDSELSENGILIGQQLENQIDQQNKEFDTELESGKNNELVKDKSKLMLKSNLNQWIDEPIESFLVCICNVSIDQPYTILKCSVKCTSLDVINQCLQKARRQDEKCENFVLVEELINESSSTTTTFNASLLDPLISLGASNLSATNQQSSATNANVLNCAGLSTSTYTVNTSSNAVANLSGTLLNVANQTTSSQSNQKEHGLFSFNSNCSLNRKEISSHHAGCTASSINASNATLNNSAYVRRILPDNENIYEVQRYWFGRGRFRLMLKIEAISIPNILVPDNFDLKIPTDVNLTATMDIEEFRDLKDQNSEFAKDAVKEEKLQVVSTKTMKTFKNLKNTMSMKKKGEYESLPSTPSKHSGHKIHHRNQMKDDLIASTSKQQSQQNLRSQSVYQSPQHSLQQTFFKSTTKPSDIASTYSSQISGQLNKFTKHARNSLKKLNRFGASKRSDKDSRDNTDSSTCG